MVQNKGLIFKSVPTDWPVEGKDLTIEDRGFDLDAEPSKDGITTKNYHISFDPYQRGRMRAPEVASYSPPFTLGAPITNSAVSKVLKSNNSKFKHGDIVTGTLPTEEYSSISGEVRKFRSIFFLLGSNLGSYAILWEIESFFTLQNLSSPSGEA